ncbi:hypothetical protein [Fusibacter bizertensis]
MKNAKRITLMLILTLLLTGLSSSYGESYREEDVYRINNIHNPFLNQVQYDSVKDTHTVDEINQMTLELIRKELLSRKTLNTAIELKSLQVPVIGQFNSAWRNELMINYDGSSTTTIGYSGCNLTAHAAVASYMNNNRNYTPKDVNNKLIELFGQSVEYKYDNLTLNNFLNIRFSSNDFIANNSGISYSTLFFQSMEKVRLNRPIIIGYRYGSNYNNSHFIVIDGFEYDSSISPDVFKVLNSPDKSSDSYTKNLNALSSILGQLRIMDPRDQGSRKWVDSTYFNDKKITRMIMYQYK